MRRITPALIAVSVLAVYGCQETIGPGPDGPAFAIQDASHDNGTAHFYWSTPIVQDPGSGGIFDPTYRPVVQVCEWNGSACVAAVAEFRTGKGSGDVIKVDLEAERYFVNWHTGQCRSGPCTLNPAKNYRIRVLIAGLEAGFVDVDLVSSRAELRSVDTAHYVPVVHGTTLPIRFRLERGLTLSNPDAAALPRLERASHRYRNRGVKPGTGSAGSVTVQGRALLGADGTTLVELTTGELDQPAAAAGNFEKVQFKQLDANGETVATMNFNGLAQGGTWSHTFTGFPRRAPLQVQASITGIDANRTSVVTVPITVALRPDLEARDLALPATTTPGMPVVITAVVAEKNGDAGASGDCRLYVNDTLADEAPAIWVDAGDAVGCNFAHTFLQAGVYAVRVAIENVTPGDDNSGNNAVTGSLTVANSAVPSEASAQFVDEDFTRSWTTSWRSTRTDDPAFLLYQAFEGSEQSRAKVLSGWQQWSADGEVDFPLAAVRVFQGSGAAVAADYTLASVAATNTYSWDYADHWGRHWGHESCYSAPAPAGQAGWLTVCASNGQFQPHGGAVQTVARTRAYATAERGRVQYLARDFFRWIYTPAGEDYTGESLYLTDATHAGTIGDVSDEMSWTLNVQGIDAGTGAPLTFSAEVTEPWFTSSWTEDGPQECFAGDGVDDVWVFEFRNCFATTGYSRTASARRYLQ